MIWPFKRRKRRELEEAQEQQQKAEQRHEEIQPLAHNLKYWDRANHLSLRVKRSFLGGHRP